MRTAQEVVRRAWHDLYIWNNSDFRGGVREKATAWCVVDGLTADPDVNWPGELVSEHSSLEGAEVGFAAAVLECLRPHLREIVDLTHGYCNEDQSVCSTVRSDSLIDSALGTPK